MEKVYIIGACRTPIGRMGGGISEIPVVELGASVIKEAITRSKVDFKDVEHIIMGCVLQAGQGQNVARQAALKAGLNYGVTALTLNAVCGSGLESVNTAARMIQCRDADIVVAGGMENMSMSPFALLKGRYGYRMGYPALESNLVDTMVYDALWDSINNYHMGVTAENVAKEYNLSREELDNFALDSQKKAQSAIESGAFDEEIVPITKHDKNGDVIINKDESPRFDSSLDKMSSLKPAFLNDGIVTAGNSSPINDGAAAVVLISEHKMKELGLSPLVEWMGGTLGGVNPSVMGIGPVISTRKLLDKLSMTINEIDLIEANEAFAAQSLAVSKELGFDYKKLNINGGAIALGHPVGASGCRILVTLIYSLIKEDLKTGLATLCIGGGMGCSTIIRR